jgi:hypothetical protein
VRTNAIVFVLLTIVGCSTNPQKRVPREAANAMVGSPETLTAISGLIIEGRGIDYEPSSKPFPDVAPKYTVASLHRDVSFRRGQWRQEATLLPAAATKDASPQIQIIGLDGKLAFNITPNGTPERVAGPDAGQARRAQLYHHPIGYLLGVFSRNYPLNNARTEGGLDVVDMTVDGTVYSLYVDIKTKLPAKIVSKEHGSVLGEVTRETAFDRYVKSRGYTLPTRITTRLDNRVISEIDIERQTAGPDVLNLAAPAAIRPAAARGTNEGKGIPTNF